jgi:DNA-binding transcriptional MerR regulator
MAIKNNKKPVLKMKELVDATGISKSTILHYLSQGLLPKPFKTHRNMAYYPSQCIDRLQLIQHLKRNHRLSLSEIRQVITSPEETPELSQYLKLNNLIFGSPQTEDLFDREQFCNNTGLTEDQLDELIKTRLINPLVENQFDQEDVTMGKMYWRAYSWGMKATDLTYYVELGEKIVDHEVELRNKMTNTLSNHEDAVMTIEMVKNARMGRAYIIDRLFRHRVSGMKELKTK